MRRFSAPESEVSKLLLPHALVHRGTVEAAAILVSPHLVGQEKARQRVLALWESGAALHEIEGDLLLIFAAPRRLRFDAAPGLPLVRDGNFLLAAPFDDAEKCALKSQFEGAASVLVTLQNGAANARVLAEETRRDPAAWLDLESFSLVEGDSLGAPPKPAELVLAPRDFAARDRLAGAPADDKLQEMLQSLQSREANRSADAAFDAANGAWLKARWALATRRIFDGIFGLFDSRGKIVGVSKPLGGIAHPGDLRFALSLALLLFGFNHATTPAVKMFSLLGIVYVLMWRFFGPALLADRGAKSRGESASTRAAKARETKEPTNAWARMMARTAMMSGLARVIGRKQAQYIARTMKMFEQGDIEGALRHAIPLQSLERLASGAPKPMFLGRFSPRNSLDINTQMHALGGTSTSISPEFMAHLRKIYRDAFEKMEARGELDKAAFVLAELLNSSEEAVAFLEKHKKLQLAAELAEARKLAPGLVVRQWFLAGDQARALDFARSRGAFADAIFRLERTSHTTEADALRLQWAQFLAQSGNHLGAVQAAWQLAAARPLLFQCLDDARKLGGGASGRALAWRALLAPEHFASTREATVALLEEETFENVASRVAFSMQLLESDTLLQEFDKAASTRAKNQETQQEKTAADTPQNIARDAAQLISEMMPAPMQNLLAAAPETIIAPHRAAQILARAAVRSALRDSARGALSTTPAAPQLVKNLVELSGDGALRADVPKVDTRLSAPLWSREDTLHISLEADDAGALEALDVAALPDGRIVVALGEAGARLLSRGGRVLASFDEPAHRLVVSRQGDRAIALARRGRVWKIARLDFLSRTARPWCEAEIACFADNYDGALWFVATRDAVGNSAFLAIDAAARDFRALWDTPHLEGEVQSIRISPHSCALLLQLHAQPQTHSFFGAPQAQNAVPKRQRWQFDLPGLVLRRRDFLPEETSEITAHSVSVSPRGAILRLVAKGENGDDIAIFLNERRVELSDALRGFALHSSALCDDEATWIAFIVREISDEKAAPHVVVLDAKELRVRAMLHLGGATQTHLRFGEGALTCADDKGRVTVLDLESGALRNALRLR